MSDIKIKNDDGEFKLRVCGVIKNEGKYLMIKNPGNDFYCLPGGHVELGEDTLVAVKREMSEEIKKTTKNERLFAIIENFFEGRGHLYHELGFYYFAKLEEKMSAEDFEIDEIDKGEKKHLLFKWASKEELKNIDFRPTVLKDLILNDDGNVKHIINKD